MIKTSKPNAAMLDAMTFVFMLPKHAIGAIAPKDLVKNTWWSTSPIGTGPFKWSKYVPDQYVELVANESYWRGKPKLDKLINRYFKEPGSALIALQRGEIQFVYVTADESEIVKKDANLTLHPRPVPGRQLPPVQPEGPAPRRREGAAGVHVRDRPHRRSSTSSSRGRRSSCRASSTTSSTSRPRG